MCLVGVYAKSFMPDRPPIHRGTVDQILAFHRMEIVCRALVVRAHDHLYAELLHASFRTNPMTKLTTSGQFCLYDNRYEQNNGYMTNHTTTFLADQHMNNCLWPTPQPCNHYDQLCNHITSQRYDLNINCAPKHTTTAFQASPPVGNQHKTTLRQPHNQQVFLPILNHQIDQPTFKHI